MAFLDLHEGILEEFAERAVIGLDSFDRRTYALRTRVHIERRAALPRQESLVRKAACMKRIRSDPGRLAIERARNRERMRRKRELQKLAAGGDNTLCGKAVSRQGQTGGTSDRNGSA